MQHHVIIVAGGSGARMQTAVPKQFLLLNGLPVLMHTIAKFYSALPDAPLILVLPQEHLLLWEDLRVEHAFHIPHRVVEGGQTRFHSVKNGLAYVQDGWVAVHDGVRPLVSSDTILRSFEAAQKTGAAVPVLLVNESTREVLPDGNNAALNRTALRTVQTPQCFDALKLKQAFEQEYSSLFTDDASVMEAAGFRITLVEGNAENIKLTRPVDLLLAELLLKNLE